MTGGISHDHSRIDLMMQRFIFFADYLFRILKAFFSFLIALFVFKTDG